MEAKIKKITAIALVKEFFKATLEELRALPAKDRIELASAIARSKGLTQDDCEFSMVEY